MPAALMTLAAHLAVSTTAHAQHRATPPIIVVPFDVLNDDIVVYGRNDQDANVIRETILSPDVDLSVVTDGLVRGVVGPSSELKQAEAAWSDVNKTTVRVTR